MQQALELLPLGFDSLRQRIGFTRLVDRLDQLGCHRVFQAVAGHLLDVGHPANRDVLLEREEGAVAVRRQELPDVDPDRVELEPLLPCDRRVQVDEVDVERERVVRDRRGVVALVLMDPRIERVGLALADDEAAAPRLEHRPAGLPLELVGDLEADRERPW
jgi:hypothetical protein